MCVGCDVSPVFTTCDLRRFSFCKKLIDECFAASSGPDDLFPGQKIRAHYTIWFTKSAQVSVFQRSLYLFICLIFKLSITCNEQEKYYNH